MPVKVELRPVTPLDEEFLFRVYASTRRDVELFGWGPAETNAFIRSQFEMRSRSYAMQSPNARSFLILSDGRHAGSAIIDRSGTSISLTDIAVLPEFRGKGIATQVINGLIAEARDSGVPVVLSVDRTNAPAFGLYTKLGFEVVGEDAFSYAMRWDAR